MRSTLSTADDRGATRPAGGANRAALVGTLAAASIVLSIVENIVLPGIPLPGVRYGLGNLPLLFGASRLGFGELAAVAAVRVVAVAVATGGANPIGLALSGGGAIAALAALALFLRARRAARSLTLATAGTLMAAAHVTAQIALARLLLGTPAVFSYLPLAGTVSAVLGFAGGAAAAVVERRRGEGR